MKMRLNQLMPCSVFAFAAVALLSGCSGTVKTLEGQVDELEREVTRLRAEKANLVARSTALDDKVVILEKRADKCTDGSKSKGLEVVRLTAEDSMGYDEAVLEDQVVSWKDPEDPKSDEKRPVLTLRGYGAPAVSAPRATGKKRRVGPVPPTGLGDNLGVVKVGAKTVESSPEQPGAMASFQTAYRAYSNRSYDEALSGFSAFIQANPGHGYVDNAMYWRAECYLAKGKLLKAVGEYERLLRKYPKSEKGPSALYRIGLAYDRLNDRAKAREYYFKVVDRHPGTDAARKASRRVAALTEKGGASGLLETSLKR